MSEVLPIVYLARHGETAWTITGQHTGLTDLPLTERGQRNARRLAERLRGLTFARVFTSPMQCAARTTLIVFSSLSRKPLVVVHFSLIKPLYDIPIQLPNVIAHFMIFSKSKNTISYNSLIFIVFLFWHENGLLRRQMQDSKTGSLH